VASDVAPAPRAHAGALRVGVISDTHGNLTDAALRALAGTDAIIHAGDIESGRGSSRYVLDQLRAIAPVTAVRGNGDNAGDEGLLDTVANVRLGGARFLVGHKRGPLTAGIDLLAAGVDVVVTGHSHKANIERTGGVLYVNPGTAGDDRGHGLSIAIVTVAPDGRAEARIVEL
jgi:putative phosphoesterase